MKTKSLSMLAHTMSTIFALVTLTLTFAIVPVSAPEVYGPWMENLHIKNYGSPDAQFAALDTGEIDFTDWPYTKPWIDKFAAEPEAVTLNSYAEIGTWEYDINCQKWPTGCDGLTPHTRQRPETGAGDGRPPGPGYDWDPDTQTWKVYFDPVCPHCIASWGFRLAVNYLTDTSYIVTEILKGYGYPVITWIPTPALAGWLDVENLTESSFTYHGSKGDVVIPSLVFKYDEAKAAELLDAAGFTMITTGSDAGKRQDPRKPAGQALSSIIYYIRLDDGNREAAGLKQAADLQALGIPVDVRDVEKTVCFKSVMVEYNYNIYTGGFSFGADPWFLYSVFSSSQYWKPIGFSGGYEAFCNEEADYWLNKAYEGSSYEEILEGVHKSTYLLNKYAVGPNLWSYAAVQGYRTGWEGVVNHEGYGPVAPVTGGANMWTLFNARWTGAARTGDHENTIWWGFKSNLEGPHVITAEWVWDWQVLTEIYDQLLWRNPYNLAEDVGFMAETWETVLTEWAPGKGYITFTLRPGMKWNDGSPVEPADIKFSLEFTRDCGPGVAWNYPGPSEIERVDTKAEDPSLGPMDVRVYFNSMSFWALHWAGYTPIMSRKVWLAANDALDWGYVWPHAPGHFWDWNRLAVREYHPWTADVYNAVTGGVGSDGTVDLAQDGSGPWTWVGGNLLESVDLKANRNFFWSQNDVANFLATAFHAAGDVNRDGVIDIRDINAIARGSGTDASWPHGTGWDQFNPDADLNGDNKVDALDLAYAGSAYGKTAG